jgi:uncharacterized Zn finger protein (UPF0148 family)
MGGCAGIKANGERCRGIAATGSDYCPAHDPDRHEARSRAASKAAKSKSNKDLQGVKSQLQSIADRTLANELDARRATAAVQSLNAKIRAIEVERRVREEDELFERLGELERRARERWAG